MFFPEISLIFNEVVWSFRIIDRSCLPHVSSIIYNDGLNYGRSSDIYFIYRVCEPSKEKKTPIKKGFWWLPWLKQTKKQSQQPFLHRGLSCKLLSTKLPLAEPALIRVSWNPISTNWIEAFSIQSEQLYSDQSGPVPLDQTVRIWIPHVHEDRPIRDQRQGLLSIEASFPLACGGNFPLKTVFPQLQLKHGRCLTGADQSCLAKGSPGPRVT